MIDATGNGHDGQLIGDARRIVSPLPTPDQMHQQYLQSLQLGISVQRRKPSQFTDVLSITVRRVPESTVWKVPSVPVQIEIRDEAKALLATLQSRTDATVNWAVPNEVVGTLLMTAKQTSASGKTLSAQFVCLAHNIVPVTPQVGHTEVYDAASGLDGYEVTDIFLDRNGMLWFASQGAGVSQYDGREFKTFTAQDGLPSNDIRTIFEDSNGVLWFGGWGGVSRYDGKTFKTFTTKDGLVDDSVMAICEAEKGLLWFGTLKGVSRFDGASFRNYTKEDGLASDWVTAITKDHSGNLWFGSNLKSSFSNGKGATRYDGSAFKVFTTQDGHVSNLLKN